MLDFSRIKSDFSMMVKEAQPWTLTQFVMWLDLKLSEYKIKGYMVLDNETTTKPRWLSPDDEADGSEVVPQPPSCPKCNSNNQGQGRTDSSRQGQQTRGNSFQRQQHRNRNSNFRRQGNDSYITEVLGVGDNVQNSKSLFDPSSRSDPKELMPQVISLEPATDLTAEDIEEMDQVFQNKDSSVDNVEIISSSSRGLHQQRQGRPAATVTSSADGGRGFITAGSTVGSSLEGPSTSTFTPPQREPTPPKRQVAMVDLSQTQIPDDSSYDPPPTSIRPEFSMSARSESVTSRNDQRQTMMVKQTDVSQSSHTSAMPPVPVALHKANIRSNVDPGGSAPMETNTSTDPSSTEIKQEADESFDDCFMTGTDEQSNQMYMMGDNSLSDSEASFNQGQAYSPLQNAPGGAVQPPSFGQGLYTVNDQEVELPKFEDPLVRRVLEDGAAPSRHMWSKIITRCAYHMLSKGVPHKHDYQLFSKAFYLRYPCIGTNRGPNPWTEFANGISQKVRNMRKLVKKPDIPGLKIAHAQKQLQFTNWTTDTFRH